MVRRRKYSANRLEVYLRFAILLWFVEFLSEYKKNVLRLYVQ